MRINHQATLQNALAKRAFVIVGLAVAGIATSAQAAESIGGAKSVVNLVTGDLATGDKVNVFQGDDVFRDEGVRTDADSSARLVLRDNTNLLLGPSSAIKLDRFVYAGPSQPGAIAVNLVKGALRFATGDADKKAYLIATPTAALGVRGTVLKIVSNSSRTFVVLDEGGAVVCTRAAAKRACLQLTDPGEAVVVTQTEVKWDRSASAAVEAIIAAIPDPPGAPGGPGGQHAFVTPTTVTPTVVTPAVVTPTVTPPSPPPPPPPPPPRKGDGKCDGAPFGDRRGDDGRWSNPFGPKNDGSPRGFGGLGGPGSFGRTGPKG